MRNHIFLIAAALLSFQSFPQKAVAQQERSSFSEWLAGVRAEALARGQPDGPADQPDADERDLHAAALITLPATAAARSTCST